jgi:hypothetical protein
MAQLSDGVVSLLSAADVYGHARVWGASFSFLRAQLEVLFALVVLFSSFCHHDFPGPLHHRTSLANGRAV